MTIFDLDFFIDGRIFELQGGGKHNRRRLSIVLTLKIWLIYVEKGGNWS